MVVIVGLLCGRVGNRRVSIAEGGMREGGINAQLPSSSTVRLLYNVYLLPASSKVATRMISFYKMPSLSHRASNTLPINPYVCCEQRLAARG